MRGNGLITCHQRARARGLPIARTTTGFVLDSGRRLLNPRRVPKWVKTIIAILLLPLCLGATRALFLVLRATGGADTIWVPMLAGAACWVVVFLLLPKPMWIYVVGHELTHAVWTWVFLGRVKKFKAGSDGGHVVITKNNFIITLAPYFFPLYVAMIVLIFMAGHLIWGWSRYQVWFHLLVGAAYAFHVTLTAHVLRTRQSDITQQGYLFSAVIIWLGNVAVLLLGVPLITARVDLATAVGWTLESTGQVVHRLGMLF